MAQSSGVTDLGQGLLAERDVRIDASAETAFGFFLPRLQIAAAGGDPGPDPWANGSQ